MRDAKDIAREMYKDLEGTGEEMSIDYIAAAIQAERDAANPPAGHVKLSGGRVVKVLGSLPMTADGCVIGRGAELWPKSGDPEKRVWSCRHIYAFDDKGHYVGDVDGAMGPRYSTPEAAESARKDTP